MAERRTEIICLGAQSACSGRNRRAERHRNAAEVLRQVAGSHAQQDPRFRTALAYTRLSAQEAVRHWQERGVAEEAHRPCLRAMAEIVNHMGCGGKTRADNKGCDHALGSAAKDIPGGLMDQDPGQLHMTLGGSYKTSDCLVHTRQEWGHELSAHERQGTALIPIQVDKGAESSGVRTQFLHRPVEWTDPIGKPIP